MARISFTAIVSEIVGKLAGSVFQYSYGGWQIHTRVTPMNPQTNYQQLRRGWYGFIRANWRELTNVQRQTFIDEAPSPGQGFNFFTGCNINLILVNEPMISLFTPSATPTTFDFEISAANPAQLLIKATGIITTVPTDTKLLIYATQEKQPSQIFTNPSDYSPIVTFDEGTDLSSDTNIITDYNQRFGQIVGEKFLAMKSVLIDKSNGTRGTEFLTNTTTEEMAKFTKIHTVLSSQATSGTSDTQVDNFSLPANSIVADGDSLFCMYQGRSSGGNSNNRIQWQFAGQGTIELSYPQPGDWLLRIYFVRTSSSTARLFFNLIDDASFASGNQQDLAGLDFTTSNAITLNLMSPTSGSLTLKAAYINKELI